VRPTSLRHLIARIRALCTNADLDRDFSQELDAHLEMLIEDNIRRGLAPDEARRLAAVKLGAASSLRSQHRDVRGFRFVDDFVQDVRFAMRLMNRERWFSVAAIAVIALGIGANTVGFSIVNAAFIRGMGFEDGDRLRIVSFRPDRGRRYPLSYIDLQDLRAQSTSLARSAPLRSARSTSAAMVWRLSKRPARRSPPTSLRCSGSRRFWGVDFCPTTNGAAPARSC
jgi:putative ABC transport system permease protein